ncbi:hypothetical protein V6N12_065245 [Hibiscus sabdariffa]|uniref:Uncharacterized protein n=1 Tax=Hibiscus sabdariffa TaxID=183260 RepID=A0ABR2G896_9ROSI
MGIVEVSSGGRGWSYRCSRRWRPGRGVLGRVGSHHCRDSLMPWLVLGKSEVVIVEATVYAAFGRRWVVTAFGHRWVVAAVVSSGLETLASKVRPCGGSSCVRLG